MIGGEKIQIQTEIHLKIQIHIKIQAHHTNTDNKSDPYCSYCVSHAASDGWR